MKHAMKPADCNDTHEAALQAAYWCHKYCLAMDTEAELMLFSYRDIKTNSKLIFRYQDEMQAWSARAVELHQGSESPPTA